MFEMDKIIKTYMRPGNYFLDSCVGWATFSALAKYYGYSGTGIDIWDTALECSRRQIENMVSHEGSKVDIVEMDAMATQFEDGAFDFCYCNAPFFDEETYSGADNDIASSDPVIFESHFKKLLREIYRVTKTGALTVVVINDRRNKGMLVPMHSQVIEWGGTVGFGLHDMAIQETRTQMKRMRKNDYKVRRTTKSHEYVIVFKKPGGEIEDGTEENAG